MQASPDLELRDNSATDVRVENHGSLVLFWPVSEYGMQWLDERVAVPDYQSGLPFVAVEHRLAGDIVSGLDHDGLEVVFS